MSWKKGWRDSAQFESGVAVPESERDTVAASVSSLQSRYDNQHVATVSLQSATRSEAAKHPKQSERTVKPQRFKQYHNKHDASYKQKLSAIKRDIESGAIDRLTLKIGRERYQCGDFVTKRLRVDLCKAGLLVRIGRRYRVPVAA